MGEQNSKISSQRDKMEELILSLETITAQDKTEQEMVEDFLTKTIERAPDNVEPDSDDYYSVAR